MDYTNNIHESRTHVYDLSATEANELVDWLAGRKVITIVASEREIKFENGEIRLSFYDAHGRG